MYFMLLNKMWKYSELALTLFQAFNQKAIQKTHWLCKNINFRFLTCIDLQKYLHSIYITLRLLREVWYYLHFVHSIAICGWNLEAAYMPQTFLFFIFFTFGHEARRHRWIRWLWNFPNKSDQTAQSITNYCSIIYLF